MNKNTLIIASLLLLSACQILTRPSYTIEGEVSGIESGWVLLQDRIHGLMVTLDSARIENGRFQFHGRLDEPLMLYMQVGDIGARYMLFTENEEISIKADASHPGQLQVQGSKSHDIYERASTLAGIFDEELNNLQQRLQAMQLRNESFEVDRLNEMIRTTRQRKQQAIREFIEEHADSPAAVFIATRQLAHDLDGEQLQELVNIFHPSLKNSRYLTALQERADKLLLVAPGQTAPDFSQATPDGQIISLSEFRGKYVLISFWASWCPFCREENPHLLAFYETHSGSSFEILGVSLDRNHEAWINGIREDQLPWPQVSDLAGWQNAASSMYAVASIPTSVLVGPDGIILERNPDLEALAARLKAIEDQIL